MESRTQSKRKMEEGTAESESSYKKPHSEEQFSPSEINADSTHLFSNDDSSLDDTNNKTVLEKTDQYYDKSNNSENNFSKTLHDNVN